MCRIHFWRKVCCLSPLSVTSSPLRKKLFQWWEFVGSQELKGLCPLLHLGFKAIAKQVGHCLGEKLLLLSQILNVRIHTKLIHTP